MKLRQKMIALVILFLFLSLMSVAWIADRMMMQSYLSLEEENAKIEAERAINAVEILITRLEPLVVDWAHWDDTYEFVEAFNTEYIYSNIVSSTFQDPEMEYMIIQDSNFRTILQRRYNLDGDYFTSPSQEIQDAIQNHINQSGIIWINGEAVVISVSDIKDSDNLLEPNGIMAFGYTLSDDVLDDLRESFKTDVHIEQGLKQWEDDEVRLERSEAYTVASFQVPYMNADLAMQVNVKVPNKITALGKRTVENFIVIVGLMLIVFAMILFWGLRNIIIRRLSKLSYDVYQITHSEDLGLRLSIEGKDEISELKDDINRMLEKIEDMNSEITAYATYDTMTGTLNRRAGYEALDSLINVSKIRGTDLCIAYVDINNLKLVNDKYGHQAGDQLIKDVTGLLEKNIRQSDRICRLGGDEFLLIFPAASYETVEQVFERIHLNVEEFNRVENRSYKVAISKGIAIYAYEMTVDEFIEIADKRMYEEKQKRKREDNRRDDR